MVSAASALNTLLKSDAALAMKEKSFGERLIEAALTRNGLGEAQLKLGKLDEAQRNFEIAVQVRNEANFRGMDAAYSRENLAQALEAKGNLIEAKEVRRSGAPDALVCTNFSCPRGRLSLKNLRKCTICKSVYYCSETCQKRDWTTRHKPLCRATQ
ncbi:hypothetical protein ACEPAH_651 [Sanghuangporus vaninii]